MRQVQVSAPVRWHAQERVSQDQAEAHPLQGGEVGGLLAVQLQTDHPQTLLRRHPQAAAHPDCR